MQELSRNLMAKFCVPMKWGNVGLKSLRFSLCLIVVSVCLFSCDNLINRYNGVIWSNWGSNLQNVTIVGNQFAGYDKLILNEEKRTSPSNCILPLLSYFTDYPLLTDVTKVSTYSNRLLYDAFHSTSVQFVPAEAYEKGAKEGLWEQQPEEPETENDISTDVNSELVDFLKRQEEDGLWTESAGDCSSDFSSLIGSRM